MGSHELRASSFERVAGPTSEERVVVSVRLPKELVKLIDHYAVDEDLFRQGAVERLLIRGLAAAGGD